MKSIVIHILLALILFSCTHEKKKEHNYDKIPKPDKNISSLPFHFSPSHPNNLDLLNEKEVMYINQVQAFPFVQFEKHKNFTPLLVLSPADVYIPILIIYDADGQIIDYKSLITGNCSNDCGYTCSEHLEIDKNWNITITDTIKEWKCENGIENDSISSTYIKTIRGKLKSDGIIKLGRPTVSRID